MAEYDHCIPDQKDGARAHGQRTDFEQHRIDFLSGQAERDVNDDDES